MTTTVSDGTAGERKGRDDGGQHWHFDTMSPHHHHQKPVSFFFFHIILLMQSFRYLFDIMRKLVDSRGVSMECRVSYILSFGPFVFETN